MLQKDTSLVTISELFQGHEIDIVTVDHDNPAFRYWFRATDVCTVLFAQGNAQRYTTQHCRSDQFTQFQVGKGRPANYICLSGVLRMAMRSDAPCAIAFQDWLSEEALPKLNLVRGVC